MKHQSCLITGGAGFIGCAVSKLLLDHFEQVVAVDNLHPQIHPFAERPTALPSEIELIVGDVTKAENWDSLFKTIKPEVIIHLAAETGTGQSLTEASRHALVNVNGTTQMLDALVRNNIVPQRIILASSRAVYGEGGWAYANGTIVYPGQRSRAQLQQGEWDFINLKPLPFTSSDTRPNPISIYGSTKLAQEHILSSWCHSFGTELAILRLQNVYGPGQSLTNSYTGIVPLFINLAKKNKSIPLYEDGQVIRDFVFIDDVANAILLATLNPQLATEPYDIGSGQAISINHLAKLIAQRYDAPAPHITGMFRHGDVRFASCSIEKSKHHLGWCPIITLDQGLNMLCEWIDNFIV